MKLLRSLSFGLAGLAVALLASPAPARSDLVWGINGHPLNAYPGVTIEQQLDYIVRLGLTMYRVDVSEMAEVERLSELVDAAAKRGIDILPVLTPRLKGGKNLSTEDIYRESFNFAVGVITPLKNRVRVWELGNEGENFAIIQPCEMQDDGVQYDCKFGPGAGTRVLDYYGPRWQRVSAGLKGLSDGATAVDPTIRKAMGTAGWGHTAAFERMKQDGIEWDISVWHIYGEDPEWAFKLIAKYGKPIWVTEFNNPNGNKESEAKQEAGIAKMITRLRQLAQLYRVEAAHVYELLDQPQWAPDFEAYMGLVRMQLDPDKVWRPLRVKGAFEVVRKMIGKSPPAPATERRSDGKSGETPG